MKEFQYKGRTVIAIKPLTKKQYWWTYTPIFAWTIFALVLIVAQAICDCVGFYTWTVAPYLVWTVWSFVWTYFTKKRMIRKNYVYDG